MVSIVLTPPTNSVRKKNKNSYSFFSQFFVDIIGHAFSIAAFDQINFLINLNDYFCCFTNALLFLHNIISSSREIRPELFVCFYFTADICVFSLVMLV